MPLTSPVAVLGEAAGTGWPATSTGVGALQAAKASNDKQMSDGKTVRTHQSLISDK
jgi:hypothetical protein